jgi:uncharacterized protein YjiS (DUF1127 family)
MAPFARDHADVENPVRTTLAFGRGLAGRLGTLIAYWRAYARAVGELSSLTDRELRDLGIARCNIAWIARQSALAGTRATPREDIERGRTAGS